MRPTLSPILLALSLAPACGLISTDDYNARMDLDGDGIPRPTDCDDNDATVGAPVAGFIDADADGYGVTTPASLCPADGAVAPASDDCNDGEASVHPGATEVCNGVDDDCNGTVDDGVEPPTWYFDGDSDGYGNPATTIVQCTQPTGYVASGTDCDDADPTVNPDTPWYPDVDGDGYGDTTQPTASCEQPGGLIRDGTDCDDTRADVSPAGQEVCDTGCTGNGCDEDCDGLVDSDDPSVDPAGFRTFYADADGDGYGDATVSVQDCDTPAGYVPDGRDCDDTDATSGIECAWIKVSAGYYDSCGIRGSGLAQCWGDDDYGLVSDTPTGAFVDIAVSERGENACGVRPDGSIECWGTEDAYLNPSSSYYSPPPIGTFRGVCMGAYHACALADDGTISCWGQTSYGLTVPPSGAFATIACGGYTDVALAADGTATSWGYDDGAGIQLDGTDFTAVSAGYYGICGLDSAGSVSCVGDDTTTPSDLTDGPPRGPFAGPFSALAAGRNFVCMLDADGNLTCETNVGVYYPRGGTWLSLDTGFWGYCGILTTGKLSCDGSNDGYGAEATDPPI